MTQIELSHPAADQLAAFANGRLDDDQWAEIESHLAECKQCTAIAAAARDDSFCHRVRRCATPGVSPDAVGQTNSWSVPQEAIAVPADSSHANSLRNQPATNLGSRDATVAAASVPESLLDHPRYRVLEWLGSGGMGTVYKAEHRLMERPVALKIMARRLTERPEAVERFRREVKTAARLAHPNIVTSYDAEQAGETHFLVMEYVEGITLARLVAQQGPLPVGQACDYVRQAALGLDYAHQQGMVHRDIKPQNLMRSSEGRIKILDFGLARLAGELAPLAAPADVDTVSDLDAGTTVIRNSEIVQDVQAPRTTGSSAVIGTPDYIAPEQARDPRSADIRADIYSLGCTLYYLLAGNSPYPAGSAADKVLSHLTASPRPLSDLRDDVSEELRLVIERMMAKDPAERYQTPGEVAEALVPFSDEATQQRLKPIVSRWPLRHRIATLAIAAGLFGVALWAASQVIVRVKDKSGKVTEQKVPAGATVEVAPDATVIVTPARTSPAQGISVRQVWAPADDTSGAPSPDGRYLSFVDQSTGELAIRDLVTGENRRITNTGKLIELGGSPGNLIYSPAGRLLSVGNSIFSPDGRQLAYVSYNSRVFRRELCIVGIDGSGPRVLYAGDEPELFAPRTWSRDGRQILVDFLGDAIGMISVADGSARLIKRLDERNVVFGQRVRRTDLSPDGRYIAYEVARQDADRKRDIFLLAVDGSGETPLVTHPADDSLLGWAPDGQRILFASDRSGTWDAWLIEVIDGKAQSEALLLKEDVGRASPMGFTRDGTFFYGVFVYGDNIYVATIDPHAAKVIASPQVVSQPFSGVHRWPCWSPDGRVLAYASFRQRQRDWVICLLSPATGRRRELRMDDKLKTFWYRTSWSVDGRSILQRNEDLQGHKGIFQIDVETEEVKLLIPSGPKETFKDPQWSLDGKAVYYWVETEDERRIVRYNLKSEQLTVLYRTSKPMVNAWLSPDGAKFAFTTPPEANGQSRGWTIWTVPTEASEPQELVRDAGPLGYLAWTPDSRSLLFWKRSERNYALCRIPANGGQSEELELGVRGTSQMSLNLDGRTIAFVDYRGAKSEVWAMENLLPPEPTAGAGSEGKK